LSTRQTGCPAIPDGTDSYSGAEIASIPGYLCAAKAYPADNEDPNKPILLLFHGNSDTPNEFEQFPSSSTPAPMLADEASRIGFRVLAVDLRFDEVDDPTSNLATENAARNFDHGWATPIAQHFIESVMSAYPHRSLSIVGFGEGVTVVRDALRRLHRANKKPFQRIQHIVLAAGANHGIEDGQHLCDTNPTMRGRMGCQLGDRTAYTPTPFLTSLNGPDGAFETPCVDGNTAFGQHRVCGGHKVRYTTIVMEDSPILDDLKEEFVSQTSSALKGASNLVVPPTSIDSSKYFCGGLFHNHYGALRSDAALSLILNALTSP
jgi:hypothetical protein